MALLMPHRRKAPHRSETKAAKKHISGIIQITRKGTGYVVFPALPGGKELEDIEVQMNDLSGALNGDTVEVSVHTLYPRPKGKVVKIVSRAKIEFVCTIKGGVAIPADIKFYRPIKI